jgi:hypothetical protein
VIDRLESGGLCVVSKCLGGGAVGSEPIRFDRGVREAVVRRVVGGSLCYRKRW